MTIMRIRALFIRHLYLILLFGIGLSIDAYGQIDSSDAIALKESALQVLMQQRKTDSLKLRELEDKFISIQSNNSRQDRDDLESEIRMLRSRDSIRIARQKLKIDSLKQMNPGIAVVPFQDTIFRIYKNIGSYSAKDRATAVEERIISLSNNIAFSTDSLKLVETENSWTINWRDQMLISVDEQDGLWMNTTSDQLAKTYLTIIKNSIDEHRDQTSLSSVLIAIGQAVLIILLVVLIIYCISKLNILLRRKLLLRKGILFKGLSFRGYELVSPTQQVKFVWTILTIIKWILILLAIYLTLPFILNLFPSTQGYAPVLLGYFTDPLRKIGVSIFKYFPNLITIAVICVLFRYLLKALKFFAKEVHSGALTVPGFYSDWAFPTYQILRVLLFAFLMVVIFPYLPGSDSPIFKGVSVFIGVLFTFGSAGALGNIVAGLVLTYMRPFAIGDRIKIGDVTGDLMEKTLLVTRIRTIKNEVISIPNSQVMSSHTINYSADSQEKGLIIHSNFTISYEIRWQRVHELAIKAAKAVDLIEQEPSPFVMQQSLDDFYVTYQINAYTKHPNKQAVIYSDLRKNILDVFHEAGIELLSPHYQANRDGSKLDMPSNDDGSSVK